MCYYITNFYIHGLHAIVACIWLDLKSKFFFNINPENYSSDCIGLKRTFWAYWLIDVKRKKRSRASVHVHIKHSHCYYCAGVLAQGKRRPLENRASFFLFNLLLPVLIRNTFCTFLKKRAWASSVFKKICLFFFTPHI